jgi:hypothetical protein
VAGQDLLDATVTTTSQLTPLGEWHQPGGTVTTWVPTAATLDAVRAAPPSPVPPSHQQRQHLRAFERFGAEGLPMSRIVTVAWTEPGQCDLAAMTEAIDAHLQRHDTYASTFATGPDGELVRSVLDDPTVIRFEPQARGAMEWCGWRESLLDLPGPLAWDCMRFHVVQYPDRFTVCVCIDHVRCDGSLVAPVFDDLHSGYRTLVGLEAPAPRPPSVSHLTSCERQAALVESLTATADEVVRWTEFLDRPTRSPFGPVPDATRCALSSRPLVDAATAAAVEQACTDAGSRLVGGVLAAVARAWCDVTGAPWLRAIVPVTELEDQGGLGWFTGVVPAVIPAPARAAGPTIAVAQHAFESARHLSRIPPEAVREIVGAECAPTAADWTTPLVSLMDFTRPPVTTGAVAAWQKHDGRLLLNEGAAKQVGLWFSRHADGLALTIAFPDTPDARRVMDLLVERIAEGLRAAAEPGGR